MILRLSVLGALAATYAGVAQLFAEKAPEAYMDEIFHVPQAQAYCRGEWWSWDDKITTLPGAYLVAVAHAGAARLLHQMRAAVLPHHDEFSVPLGLGATGDGGSGKQREDMSTLSGQQREAGCSVALLRSVNALFALFSVLLLERLMMPRPTSSRDAVDAAGATAGAPASTSKVGGAYNGGGALDAPAPALLRAVMLALFPPLFFFAFLFYTDVLSTFFVLLTLLLLARPARRRSGHGGAGWSDAIHDKPMWCGALAGLASIVCRQTNVVWLVFGAGAALVADLEQTHGPGLGVSNGKPADGPRPPEPKLRSRNTAEALAEAHRMVEVQRRAALMAAQEQRLSPGWRPPAPGEGDEDFLPGLQLSWRFVALLWAERARLLPRLAPVLLVVGGFGAFVAANGGIVVGDRANHVPVAHFAQLGYFALFAVPYLGCATGAPVLLLRRLGAALRRQCLTPGRAGTLLWLVIFASIALWFGSPMHPFLLADNRHFPFYIWKAFFRRFDPQARVALLPAYFGAAWALAAALRRPRPVPMSGAAAQDGAAAIAAAGKPVSALWLAGFALATTLVLVPAHLVEPRYFLVPFLVAHAHAEPPTVRAALATATAAAILNAVTIYVFLYRPFIWPDGSVARFMW